MDTITPAADKIRAGLRIVPFQAHFGSTVASWVESVEQLHLLAPSTLPPLTAAKVRGWPKPGGMAFVLMGDPEPRASARAESHEAGEPIGYGELNPMRSEPRHYWLGHIIIAPMRRRKGFGDLLVRALIAHAFDRLDAERVSLVVFPDNTAAIHCYVRAGLRYAGEERHRFGNSGPRFRLLRFEIKRPGANVRL